MLPERAINQHTAPPASPAAPICAEIDEYIRHIRAELGLSSTTILNYQQRLRYLAKWLALNGYPDPDITCLNLHTLRRFLYDLVAGGHRPRTVKGKFAAIDGLCRYLVAEKRLEANPVDAIKLPKLDAAKRELVTDEQIAQLFEVCEHQRSPKEIALSRAVLSVLAYAGLRRAECRDLRVGDFASKAKSLTVRAGKGSNSRVVYIPTVAAAALTEWLALRGKCSHDWMFCRGDRRLHDDGLAHLIEALKSLAGLSGEAGIKPHSIRHAYATRLDARGASLVDISTALGHRGNNALRTTQIYLHSNEKRARSVAELATLDTSPPPSPQPQSAAKTSHANPDWRRRVAVRR